MTQAAAELEDLITESKRVLAALKESLGDPSAPPERVRDLLRALTDVARRERTLVRTVARGFEGALPGLRPLRERVLDHLGVTGLPSRAAMIAAHLELRDGVPTDVRRFGSLRQSEAQAHQQNPGARPIFISPALDGSGAIHGAWMCRADWPLQRRLILSEDHANLLEVEALTLLVEDARSHGTSNPASLNELIQRHARRLLDVRFSESADDQPRWDAEFDEKARFAIGMLHGLEPRTSQAAQKLVRRLSKEEQVWGRR